ncbi:zinc metalloproteinase-disintegrin-like VLAIP-B isoform X1 [Lissotriton helveticus]
MSPLLLFSAALLLFQQQVLALAPLPGVKDYEVVRPQKLYSRHRRDTKAKYPDEVHYGFKLKGEDLEVHLKRNEDLLGQNYTLTHYLPDGQEVTVYPDVKDHCYYHGYLKNESDSEASISLCNGVSGYFRTKEQRYLIEPLQRAEGEDHAVYPYESVEDTPKTCGVTNTTWEGGKTKSSRAMTSTQKQEFLKAKKYIELVMVADTSIFKKYNRSNAQVQQRIFETINYLNLVYKGINVFVALIGIEIWQTTDLITVDASASSDLDRFSAWRTQNLLKRKRHDNSQFLTNVDFEGPTVGLAYVGTMCSSDHSAGVIQDHSKSSIAVGATIAHEMGHNLGMNHDASSCSCPEKSCIMAASLSYVTPKLFSTCSHQNFQDFILNRMPECMRAIPLATDMVAPAVCGNGFIEAGEQCDCGTPQECQNPCCDATTCKLKPEAMCADGECCENCKIKSAGILCRPGKDDCDLPDLCDGQNAQCPSDRYRVNGYPCNNGEGYCYMGTCPTLKSQCVDIWGAASGDEDATSCFNSNKRGLYYGFCTYSGGKYIACPDKDIKCGKLFCKGGSNTPSVFATTLTVGSVCKVIIPTSGYVDNFGMVQNGTKCGTDSVCSSGRCLNMESVYKSTNCSSKCRGHAVCDHELLCQCEEGWAPPNCDTTSGTNIIIIVVVVLILAVTIIAILVLLWYRGTFKNKLQSCQPNTVAGLNNPGFEQKTRNQPVIVHTPELPTRALLPSPPPTPTPPSQADKPRISFMHSSDGRHQQTRVGYSSPQYVVASPSPEPSLQSFGVNAVKPVKPSNAPPPVPVSKPASTFGQQLNVPPPVPMAKPGQPKGPPVLPPAPPQALKPRPKI